MIVSCRIKAWTYFKNYFNAVSTNMLKNISITLLPVKNTNIFDIDYCRFHLPFLHTIRIGGMVRDVFLQNSCMGLQKLYLMRILETYLKTYVSVSYQIQTPVF